ADTYIVTSNPDFEDAGEDDYIYVGNGVGMELQGLIKFDVSQFSQYPTKATVSLTPSVLINGSVLQSAEAIFDHSWNESTTWNSRPSFVGAAPLFTASDHQSTW